MRTQDTILGEIWKTIPGFNGMYDVSNLGRVRSYANARWGRREVPLLMTQTPTLYGYRTVRLRSENGKSRNFFVHRLVLEAFVGPCPEGMECCHGPGGPADNRLENVTWGTKFKNHGEDRVRDGTSNRGEAHGMSTLTKEDVLEIRRLLTEGVLSQPEIAKLKNVSPHTISRIKTGKRWGWLES